MIDDELKEFIQKAKAGYKKIGHVECPAFRGEKVYFNKHGFNHLIRKVGKVRSAEQRIRRLRLLSHAPTILKEANYVQSKKLEIIDGYAAYFWSFSKTVQSVQVRVIVRQLYGGRKHFFSIMDDVI